MIHLTSSPHYVLFCPEAIKAGGCLPHPLLDRVELAGVGEKERQVKKLLLALQPGFPCGSLGRFHALAPGTA